VGHPEAWVAVLEERLHWLNSITKPTEEDVPGRARAAYIEMVADMVQGLVYGDQESSVRPALKTSHVVRTALDGAARVQVTIIPQSF
jgi:hypothetical protein